jgi:ferredoxin
VALIGAPVYAGRIPPLAVERLRRVRGDGIPAVIVVVYGNRAYEDALLELRDLAAAVGFVPLAGGAFIGEHSFSTAAVPIAHGRPDDEDVRRATDFGRGVRLKLEGLSTSAEAAMPLYVPGNYPHRDGWASTGGAPITRDERCTLCGACAATCPGGAIAVGHAVVTDEGACMLCCACVRACPSGARLPENERIVRARQWLHEGYAARREPEVYL